ncbi:alpha/beta fold hydrolase [Streptococcus pluranimalium]|uniref:alpha/beta fold hydrolase n=1 Tax=Streptococcus pluranimalium TaxID=82348 RepID=UPI0029306E5C|nr:alpha/beta fold hydrolase [Streptococcus pluranimalium]
MMTITKKNLGTTIGDLSMHYRKGNPTLIFLSGIGSFPTFENFSANIKPLPKNFGILTINYPNIGESSLKNQRNLTLVDWIEAIELVLDSLQVGNYMLITHSIAGLLGLRLMPERSGCKGFIGIEPSTVAILTEMVDYPQEFGRVNQVISEIGVRNYLQEISRQGLNEIENKALWDAFDRTEKRLSTIGKFDFAIFPDLNKSDFASQPSIPKDIPSFVFSQAFRKEEYKASEYQNPEGKCYLYLTGDHHYLHWTESEAILKVIEAIA